MREAGMTRQEIADDLGLTKEQIKSWVTRYNHRNKKIVEGIALVKFGHYLIPNPVEGFSAFTEYLKSFYEILNSRFLDFVAQLSYVEKMPQHKKDRFYATLRNIPSLTLAIIVTLKRTGIRNDPSSSLHSSSLTYVETLKNGVVVV